MAASLGVTHRDIHPAWHRETTSLTGHIIHIRPGNAELRPTMSFGEPVDAARFVLRHWRPKVGPETPCFNADAAYAAEAQRSMYRATIGDQPGARQAKKTTARVLEFFSAISAPGRTCVLKRRPLPTSQAGALITRSGITHITASANHQWREHYDANSESVHLG